MADKEAMSPRRFVQANDVEHAALAEVEALLGDCDGSSVRLVNEVGHEIALPESARRLFAELVRALADGCPVGVLALQKELTIQRAADLLDVPAAHVVRLIEDGEIVAVSSGERRRIRFDDLMDYTEHRDEARRDGLAELTRMSEEMGLYDVPDRPT